MRQNVVVKNCKFGRDLGGRGGREVNVEVVRTCDLIQTEFVLKFRLAIGGLWFVAE